MSESRTYSRRAGQVKVHSDGKVIRLTFNKVDLDIDELLLSNDPITPEQVAFILENTPTEYLEPIWTSNTGPVINNMHKSRRTKRDERK